MPLRPGQQADAADVWMRVLTNPRHVTKSGKVHNKAFSGKAIAPPTKSKPWSLELSGRLLSFTKDVERESAAFCATPPRQYSGVMYQQVGPIRSDGSSGDPSCRIDVIFTPNEDEAHADVVAYDLPETDKYVLRDWLQELVSYAAPGECDDIEALR